MEASRRSDEELRKEGSGRGRGWEEEPERKTERDERSELPVPRRQGARPRVSAGTQNRSVKLPDFYLCLPKLLAPALIIGIYYWTHLLPL